MQNLRNIPASLLSQQHQETTATSSCSRSMNRRKSRSPIPSGGTSPLTARALGGEGAGGPPPASLLLSSPSRISPFFTTSGSFSMGNSSSSPRTTSAIFGRGGGQQTTLLRHDIIGHDLKQEFRLAFQLFDSRKVGRLSYREMKVKLFIFNTLLPIIVRSIPFFFTPLSLAEFCFGLHRQLSVLLFSWLLSLCFFLSFFVLRFLTLPSSTPVLVCFHPRIGSLTTTLQTCSVAVLRTVFLHYSNKNSILLSVVGSTLLI